MSSPRHTLDVTHEWIKLNSKTEPEAPRRITFDSAFLIGLLGATLFIRVVDIFYNTLFVDEALYVLVGRNLLARDFSDYGHSWMTGSYLYPYLAAVANQMAGILGLRWASAGLSTLAALFVFLATRRLTGKTSALWAMLLFSLTGASISVGQLATYDALSIAGLAVALYAVISAAVLQDRETYYLSVAAASFILAVLAKYIALLYLPALCLIGLALYRIRGHAPWKWGLMFLLPVLLALTGFAWYNWHDLLRVLTGGFAVEPMARDRLVIMLWDEIGWVSLLAGLGGVLLSKLLVTRLGIIQRRQQILLAGVIFIVLSSLLAMPIYHLISGNGRSLWKHTVFTLVFVAPLAGYAIATISALWLRPSRRSSLRPRLSGAILTFLALIGFGGQQLDRHWIHQNSWPNVTPVVEYLRSQGVNSQTRILAEGAEIYEYYFSSGPGRRSYWQRTWSAEYKGLNGLDAMRAAISEKVFDFVILDGYYKPDVDTELVKALQRANYQRSYATVVPTGLDTQVEVQVYQAPRKQVEGQ